AEFAPLSDEEYDDCLAQIPVAVGAIAEYWHEHPISEEERARAKAGGISRPPRRRGGRSVH
ncbi:MAG: YecA family protein, partial [Rhodanobacteraceae bacterium]